MITSPARLSAAISIALLLGSNQNLTAQLPTASMQSMSRQAGQAGTSFSLGVTGERLDESLELRFTDLSGNQSGLQAEAHMAAKQLLREWAAPTGSFQIHSEPDPAAGWLEVRSLGRHGLSNPRPLLLLDTRVVTNSGDLWSTATAVALESGVFVNDRIEPLKSNFYRMELASQQVFKTVAYAKQLDSLADISLKLWDSRGNLVASGRTQGNWPAELAWQHPSDESEEYFVEVSDLLGRGGPQFFYLIESQRISGRSSLKPAESSELANVEVEPPALMRLDQLLRPSLVLLPTAERFSNPLAIDWLRQTDGKQPSELTTDLIGQFPVLLRGSLSQPAAVDFEVEQGQTLVFDVGSAALDQLTDPAIVIYRKVPSSNESGEKSSEGNADGDFQLSLVAEQDDAPYAGTAALRVRRLDPQLMWTAPETGVYRAVVLDNQSGQRPDDSMGFFLEIRPPEPRFTLIAYRAFPTNDLLTSRPRGTNLFRRGTEQIHVSLIRHDGFSGPVEVSVGGLPSGCMCHPVIIPAGATEADLILQADEEVSESIAELEILGSAQIGDQEATAAAVLATITSGVIPTHNSVISRRTGSLPLAVSSSDLAPLQVQVGQETVTEVKRGGKTAVPVTLHRTENSAAVCTLRPQALPPKVSIAELQIPADQSEASVEMAVAEDAPLGTYTLWFQMETKVKWRVNPEALSREEEYLGQLQIALESLESTEAAAKEPSEVSSNGNQPERPSREALESVIASTQQRIEQLQKETAEQEIPLWLPSNTLRIQIVESE